MAKIYRAPWRQPALVRQATTIGPDGRLSGKLQLSFTEHATTSTTTSSGELVYSLMGPDDVIRLVDRAIRHRAPGPGTPDAETTKLVHIDFTPPDFPWRLTPEPATAQGPRPWLALLIATPEGLAFDGQFLDSAPSTAELLAEPCHNLDNSRAWAHAQVPATEAPDDLGIAAGDRFSRVVSLKPLLPQQSYVALLVKTFNRRGGALWDAQGKILNESRRIRVLDSWQFATSEAGDFESLAAALHAPDSGDIGRAKLTYARAAGDFGPPLEVRGALSSLRDAVPPVSAAMKRITSDLRGLHELETEPGTAELLALPEYGLPWVPDPAEAGPGWVQELRVDPRHRVHAGTGVWMGVQGQDELMRAAAEQAGALNEASDRIGYLAFGLLLGARAWRRALSGDPGERLRVLGPISTKLLTNGGTTVATAVTGPTTRLTPALFTSAAQRLFRRGARLPGVEEAPRHAAMLDLINGPENPPAPWEVEAPPKGSLAALSAHSGLDPWRTLGGYGIDSAALFDLLRRCVELARDRAAGVDPAWDDATLTQASFDLESEIDDQIRALRGVEEGCGELMWIRASEDVGIRGAMWGFGARLLTDPGSIESLVFTILQPHIVRCLSGCGDRSEQPDCREPFAPTPHLDPPDPARAIDLIGLSKAIQAVLDPRGETAPARGRVLDRITPAVASLAPMRYALGLDFPTWSFLKRHEPDWLLPGADSLAKDSVTALQTNPAFIDAYLLGINSQLIAEARWRGMPVDRWGTPLKMFFGPVDAVDSARGADITPIGAWTADSMLGTRTHQASRAIPGDEQTTERLVIIFHSALFRRYPRTVVYLHKGPGTDTDLSAAPDLTPPEDETLREAWYAGRVDFAPAFTGSLDADRVFFGFDVAPDDLRSFWLMLDEPPTELRFRLKAPGATEITPDEPTRVAIEGAKLAAMAEGEG